MWELIQWVLGFLLLMVLCVWAIHVLLRAEERDRREEANNDHEE